MIFEILKQERDSTNKLSNKVQRNGTNNDSRCGCDSAQTQMKLWNN